MDHLLNNPQLFVKNLSTEQIETIKSRLKSLYDQLKRLEQNFLSTQRHQKYRLTGLTLPELVTNRLDDEQIWQQLELQNDSKIKKVRKLLDKEFADNTCRFIFEPDEKLQQDDLGSAEELASASSNLAPENPDDDEEEDLDENDLEEDMKKNKTGEFFSEKEMNAFLDEQDRREMARMDGKESEDDDEDLEMMNDENELSAEANYKFGDFFINKDKNKFGGKKRVRFDEHLPNDDEDMMDIEDSSNELLGTSDELTLENKSSFEIRQEKLKERIETLENKNLGDKSWQKTGEVWAKHRPENSLLEEYVEFDHTTKLPPVITEQTTKSLEELVIQRIKDKAFDDVERKVKPINTHERYKNDIILDQQKSKLSLGQIYEQEYLKQNETEEVETKNEKHEEIRRMMKDLFVKLDALTNYRYTPKVPGTEVRVIPNAKSIVAEDVAPIVINDTDLLAPEEIQTRSRDLTKSSDERTKTDKLRELRKKKQLSHLKAKRREEREAKNPSTKVPKDKLKILQKLGKIHKAKSEPAKKRKIQS